MTQPLHILWKTCAIGLAITQHESLIHMHIHILFHSSPLFQHAPLLAAAIDSPPGGANERQRMSEQIPDSGDWLEFGMVWSSLPAPAFRLDREAGRGMQLRLSMPGGERHGSPHSSLLPHIRRTGRRGYIHPILGR